MKKKVAIVAAAQTKFEQTKESLSIGEIVWEVVEKVIKETGLKFEAQEGAKDGPVINKVISCSEDYWQGRTISDMIYHQEMGALGMDATKVAGDGAFAVYYGVVSILGGKKEIVLVVSWLKESETARSIIENAAFDPIYVRPLGMDFITSSALQATRYMNKYGITEEQCAEVVVKNKGNAFKNPYAQEPMNLTVADVLNSQVISSPIKVLESKPVSDGACALILAKEGIAQELTSNPVWITGIGCCYDAHYPGDRDLAECEALKIAAQKAYNMAEITDPFHEIDVAEISEEYAYRELLWMEGLGFCDRGEAGKMVQEGVTRIDGKLPVNPSGGVLAGNPVGVAGMVRVGEAYLQLQGQAGDRQVADAGTALAHGVYGPNGQAHCVIVLRK